MLWVLEMRGYDAVGGTGEVAMMLWMVQVRG